MSKESLLPTYRTSFRRAHNSFIQFSDHFIKTRKFRILSATLGLFLCSLWIVARFGGTAFNINTLRRFRHNGAAIAAASVMGECGEEGIYGLEVHGYMWPNRRKHDSQKKSTDGSTLFTKIDEEMKDENDFVDLDPLSTIEYEIYYLIHENPVVIFTKTDCPESQSAKDVLSQYDIFPIPLIIEIDKRGKYEEEEVKEALTRFTYLNTLPSIFVDSVPIGDSEELSIMHKDGRLEKLLIDAGVLDDHELSHPAL
ncbi:462_t:CDS:2 [Acaulospora morrowiae]|uniref:462_t:CDS:1 n=1 Tax=Acaulospora morrowiae TaxID=94023 RepID=A0A9N8V950_9GLOM|nr:462_t:CDS:2 [Acaulospora morrowiae]